MKTGPAENDLLNCCMSESEDQLKMAAAESAVALVTDGIIVRLGSRVNYSVRSKISREEG